jgi:hypothetical protein
MASVLISLGVHIVAILILALVIKGFNGLATSPLILPDEEALSEESFEPIPLNIEAQEDAVEHESFSVTDLDVPANDDLASHLVSPELSTETDFGGFGEALSSLPLMLEHAGEAFSLSSVEGAPGGRSRKSGGLGSEQAFGGDIGRRLARAGAKTGAIQVSLAWNNINGLSGNSVGRRGCPCQSSGVGNRAEPGRRSEVSFERAEGRMPEANVRRDGMGNPGRFASTHEKPRSAT